MSGALLNISDIQLFTILKAKLGEKEAESLVSFVKAEAEKQIEEKYQYFSRDLESLKKELMSDNAAKIADSKAEMIKWMFIFVFTSTITTIGAILAIIKFFLKP